MGTSTITLIIIGILAVQTAWADNVIFNANINNANISQATDPCAGQAIGGTCTDGAIYAGRWNIYRYETTPGNCTDYVDNSTYFTPTCDGAADTVKHPWANNSGTSAYNIVTGISSTTDGRANTTALLSYTDTDAARYCHFMNYAGHTDWYLPAASLANDADGELKNVLYTNQGAIGGFQAARYWSSTEGTNIAGRTVDFSNGNQAGTGKTTNVSYIRCVRRY